MRRRKKSIYIIEVNSFLSDRERYKISNFRQVMKLRADDKKYANFYFKSFGLNEIAANFIVFANSLVKYSNNL